MITLQSGDGASAKIALNGAHVVSWIPAGGPEQLFLSRCSVMEPGVAIRGGIPIIFPQFSAWGDLPKHGFARSSLWTYCSSGHADTALFELRATPETQGIWPHIFLAQLRVTLSGKSLDAEFTVHNTDTTEFSFTCALHSYLRVKHVEDVVLTGLQGTHYYDSVTGVPDCIESAPELRIGGQVDRIYMASPAVLELRQPESRTLIVQSGFTDTVVWNPGAVAGAALSDLEPGGYERMLCVESAVIGTPVCLQAGEQWRGSQRMTMM